MVDLIFISDSHTHHAELNETLSDFFESYPEAIIVHTGDLSYKGRLGEVKNFLTWYSELPFKHKVFIAGNHDFLFEDNPSLIRRMLEDEFPNLTYLEDSGAEILGLKFWGSPVTPWFYNWAFNRHEHQIGNHWQAIPDDTDILITHGPPFGILDRTYNRVKAGCPLLLDRINSLDNLKIHAFGHIHEAWGTEVVNEKIFVNSSVVDLDYEVKNSPILIKL
jgi:Icc-related predicted phosphoesterase